MVRPHLVRTDSVVGGRLVIGLGRGVTVELECWQI